MEVETYEIQETEIPIGEEELVEYQKTVEELGLEGMSELLQKEGVIPFQRLDDAQRNIWKAFCPTEHKLEEYKDSIIPMRVLGLCKVGLDEKYFGRVEIWSESEKDPDPVAVGLVIGDNSWNVQGYYLIGRWGEALRSWEEIVQIAREKLQRQGKAMIQEKINILNAAKEGGIDKEVEDIIGGKASEFPYTWRK